MSKHVDFLAGALPLVVMGALKRLVPFPENWLMVPGLEWGVAVLAAVPLEATPCAAAQLQVHVTRLAGHLVRSEPATLYVGGGPWLYALDAGSGFPRWCRVLRWKGPSQQNPLMGFGAIRHVGQELYAGIQYGYLLVLDAQNGAIR